MALAAQEQLADTLGTVMVVEDDRDLREALCDTLQLANYSVIEADSAEEALKILPRGLDIRLIVSDINMGAMSGEDLLREVKNDYPHIPMLLITAYASISQSVDAMKQGAVDYLVKPFAPTVLVEAVARHLGVAQISGDEPIAASQASQQLLHLARRVAMSDSTALILGESGTGKEVLARYVHDASPRRDQPFIAINCAAIPESMLEAMLFGHEKGAYTGAHTSAPGKFEQANGGTLLLDEISEMDVGLQAKLLRVLQEREVERLGGRKTIKLDVRVIATSNRDMREQVVEGKFREDLYYRLSVLPLQWAPLRDRPEDIIPLAEKLLQKHAKKQNRSKVSWSHSARQALLAYPWPGNVRELDNVVQRALILQPGPSIDSADLALEGITAYSQKPDLLQAAEQAAQYAQNDTPAPPVMPSAPAPIAPEAEEPPALDDDLKQREYEIIMETLRSAGGSRKKTAELLGISARTLRYKVARLKEAGFTIE